MDKDLKIEYYIQTAQNYRPAKVWGRCWNGVGQRGVAQWSGRPAGQYIILNYTASSGSNLGRCGEKDFKSDAADAAPNGFKMKFDSAIQGRDGFGHDPTVWKNTE